MERPRARREAERESRREAILTAAETLFKEKGFEAATMDAVAAASEFTKRTVYQYFSGKEELLFEIAARLLARLPLALPPAGPESGSAYDRLWAFARRFYASIRALPAESALMDRALALRSALRLRSAFAPSPGLGLLETQLSALYVSFAGAVAEGRADGSLRAELEPEGAAFAVFFLLKGYLSFVAYGEADRTQAGRMGGDELADYALDLVLAGMRSGRG